MFYSLWQQRICVIAVKETQALRFRGLARMLERPKTCLLFHVGPAIAYAQTLGGDDAWSLKRIM